MLLWLCSIKYGPLTVGVDDILQEDSYPNYLTGIYSLTEIEIETEKEIISLTETKN